MVENWMARDWTPEIIAEKAKQLPFDGIYKHSKNVFGPYWDPNRPMASVKSVKRRNAHEIVNMTAEEFVNLMNNPPKDNFYYYSTNINAIGELAYDLEPWNFLELDPTSQKQNMNFWIGQKGTIADTHYDAYENFNVQIFGRKKWTVFPPDSDQPLYLYPFLHPSHAQSQVVIHEADLQKFPKVSQARALEVIMEPGDVLYLPPLWFHRVEALEDSISINCWSYCNQTNFIKEVVTSYTPINTLNRERNWNKDQLSVGIQIFIQTLLERMQPSGESSASKFMMNLLETRYSDLFRDKQLNQASDFPPFCPEDIFTRKETKALKKEMERDIDLIVKTLQMFPKDTRDVWMSNYLEILGLMTTNSASTVGAFLQSCFSPVD